MGAGRRQERLLNPKRLFEQEVALRGKAAVAGKFRRRDGGPNVIKFISRRERTIERNADHDGLKGFRQTNKSDPPAGKRCLQRELRMRDIVSSLTQGAKPFMTKRHFSHSRTTVTYGMRIGFVSTHASDIPEKLCGKLAILLLRSNVPASVVRHDTLGKRVPD